ncbi:MAG: glycosyltransferase family 2 protein [Anaeroplasmataceae bacterium]|nr:glycosyltransferase family 2 protein [Anaeroplasmataceae bacterium]
MNMWYEILYLILSIINYVVLGIIGIPLLVQVLFVLFAWVKKKTYPRSSKKGKIAYIIPAHDEEDVIYKTVKDILDNQIYPKELFDVFVIADNCTDETYKLAVAAGAKVLMHNDSNPAHHMALYPLKYGIDYILNLEHPYDMIIHLDADNHINKEFSSLMNDAYQSGVDFARPYEGALNATQNFFTKACTLFYTFDSRYGSRVRERLNLAAHINGSGAMMSVKMLKVCGGYDSTTISDDTEFNFNRMLEGYKGHYVEDAVVYEDMPSSFKDTLNRNKRIFNGGMKLLKTKLLKLFKKFFTTGRVSYIETFLSYIFIFLSFILATWIPLYYFYDFWFLSLASSGSIEVTYQTTSYYDSLLWNTIWIGGGNLIGLFVFFGILQGLILVIIDYKKIGAKNRRELISAALLFPCFLFIYIITLCCGAFSKPKWNKIKRNQFNEEESIDC